jgi:SAM-dependent methyltransferase
MDTYTHGHAEPVLQSHRWRTAENSAAYLLPSLGRGMDLLDVGCGPGTITVDLAARVAPGRVLGIDVSDEPLAEARGLAERAGVDVTFEVGDVYALAWFPADEGLDRWLDLYQRVHRRNGSEPNAGRRLLSWAHAAGLRDVVATTSSWCFASPEDREWWGTSWAGRATASSFAEQAVAYGLATTDDLAEIARAWLRWAAADDGWLGMLHGELLIRV